jgi:hypothetical protein
MDVGESSRDFLHQVFGLHDCTIQMCCAGAVVGLAFED